MGEINKEGVDPLNNDGVSGEPTEEPTLTEEQLEDLDVVDKQHYINQQKRAKKAEVALKEEKEKREALEVKLEGTKENKVETKPAEDPKGESIGFDKILEFQGKTRDLSSDEITRLTTEAEELGIPSEKYIVTSTWKNSLTGFRDESQETKKTLNQTTRVPIYKNKTYKEVMSDTKSTKEDRNGAMRAKMDAIMANRKQR